LYRKSHDLEYNSGLIGTSKVLKIFVIGRALRVSTNTATMLDQVYNTQYMISRFTQINNNERDTTHAHGELWAHCVTFTFVHKILLTAIVRRKSEFLEKFDLPGNRALN